jgi:hypothetical protein
MFTDRFIEIPIRMFDSKEAIMTGKEDHECEWISSYKKILPMRVESYEPAMPASEGFGEDKQIATSITMQSGESFLGFIHIDEFQKLLNEHQK